MIVKGKSRRDAAQLADYLLDLRKNENAIVLEQAVYHDATALHNSLLHFEHMTRVTEGSLGLYHAQISPQEHEDNRLLTHEDWIRAVDILEEKLGYQGQPRVIVLHEKDGQTHAHVVWQRAHEEQKILLPDGWNYPKHEIAARQMERAFGHKLVKGVFTGREWGEERPIAKTNHAEWQQGERTGVKPEDRKAEIAALWQRSDSGQAFVSALHQAGYELARGDKKDLHMLVKDGELYDLRRSLKSVLKDIKKQDIETRLADYPAHQLPLAAEVKARQEERSPQIATASAGWDPQPQTPEREAAVIAISGDLSAEALAKADAADGNLQREEAAAAEQARQDAIAVIDRTIERESEAQRREQAQMRERLAREQAERRRQGEQVKKQRFRTFFGYVGRLLGIQPKTEDRSTGRTRETPEEREQWTRLETDEQRQMAQMQRRHEQMRQQREELERPRDLSQAFDLAATREARSAEAAQDRPAPTIAHTSHGGGRSIKRAPVPYF